MTAEPDDSRSLVFVCHGPSCSERGSPEAFARLQGHLEGPDARRRWRLCKSTCMDHCATGPNVLIAGEGQVCTGVLPSEVDNLANFLTGGELEGSPKPIQAAEPHSPAADPARPVPPRP